MMIPLKIIGNRNKVIYLFSFVTHSKEKKNIYVGSIKLRQMKAEKIIMRRRNKVLINIFISKSQSFFLHFIIKTN